MSKLREQSRMFIDRVTGLYAEKDGKLQDIVSNRKYYENDAPEYKNEREVLRIYDLAKSFEHTDAELHDALFATCLWFVYHNIEGIDYVFVNVTEDPKTHKQQSTLNYNALCEFLYREYCVLSANSTTYCYIGSQFYPDDKGRIKKTLLKLLKEQGFSDSRKVEPIVRDILYRIKGETMKFHFPFNLRANTMIPVRNGVIVRRNGTITLMPNSPCWGFTYSLPVEYDETAPTDEIEAFIASVVNESDRELLTQIPAQALMQRDNWQVSYLLTGDGANGKSTYLSFLREFVSSENVTAISLQELCTHRFKIAELQGKLFNIYADLPKTSMTTTGMFKILTGGDEVLVEKKFGNPFQFQNKAVFVFSANELPPVDDATYAFWRRWNIIEFPHKFEPNPRFQEKLCTAKNKSGFLNLILKKMDEIETRGLKKTDVAEAQKDAWNRRMSSEYGFVVDCIELSKGARLNFTDAFDACLKYCVSRGLSEPSIPRLSAELSKAKYERIVNRLGGQKGTWIVDAKFKENKQESLGTDGDDTSVPQ